MPAQRSASEEHRDRARWHAIHRAWQRFGVALGIPGLADLERQILTGRAKFLAGVEEAGRANGHWRHAYQVKLRGRSCIAIFDIDLWCIVTLMPEGYRGWRQ